MPLGPWSPNQDPDVSMLICASSGAYHATEILFVENKGMGGKFCVLVPPQGVRTVWRWVSTADSRS